MCPIPLGAEFFSDVIEHSSLPFCAGYLDGEICYCNPAFAIMLGYTRDQILRMEWTSLSPPEWNAIESGKLAEIERTENPVRYKKEYFHHNGSRMVVELLVQRRRDEHEKTLLYAFITKITDGTEDDTRLFEQNIELASINEELVSQQEELRTQYEDLAAAEHALEASESSFRLLFENLQEGMAVHELILDEQGSSVDYQLIRVNPAFEKITGLVAEEILRSPASIIYGTGEPPFLEIYEPVTRTGEPTQFETYFEPMDKFFLISAFSPDKNQFATLFLDITRMKKTEQDIRYAYDQLSASEEDLRQKYEELSRSEEELRLSEERFRLYVEKAPIGLFITDLKGNFRYVNRSGCELTGYAEEELLKTSISSLIPESVNGLYTRELTSLISTGEMSIETELVRKNGSLVNITLDSVIIPKKRILTFCHDITYLKRIEIALRETNTYLHNLIGFANVPIIVWDTDFKITEFNRALESLSGRDRDHVLGEPVSLLFPEEEREFCMHLIHMTAAGEHLDVVEIPIQSTDGRVLSVIWNSSNIVDVEGNLTATIAQGADITERKRLISQIEKNLAELAILNDGIRNPLSVISVVADLYLPDHSEMVLKEVDRIDNMITQLDRRWIESEKILNFLQRHYGMLKGLK